MGRYGFHSGKVEAARVKAGRSYINERQWIPISQTDQAYATLGNQTLDTPRPVMSYVNSGAAGSSAVISGINSQQFFSARVDHEAISGVSFSFVAPATLKRDTKVRISPYWTTGGFTGATDAAGSVVMRMDYWPFTAITEDSVSGVFVTGKQHFISGIYAVGNVTTTHILKAYTSGILVVRSGAINVTSLEIPAGDIAANDLVSVFVYRQGNESVDDFAHAIYLLGNLIEYVDE